MRVWVVGYKGGEGCSRSWGEGVFIGYENRERHVMCADQTHRSRGKHR